MTACPERRMLPDGFVTCCQFHNGHPGAHEDSTGFVWTVVSTCTQPDGHAGLCDLPQLKQRTWMDAVNHPLHYNSHPSGIECITIAEHHNFNIGSVLKYLWRVGLKPNASSPKEAVLEDLKKARWYIDREIARLEKP